MSNPVSDEVVVTLPFYLHEKTTGEVFVRTDMGDHNSHDNEDLPT